MDTFDTMIPPLLVQPLVENAIIHGLENTSTKGKISLSFTCLSSNELTVDIEDNGIGIENAKNLNNTHTTKITELEAELQSKTGDLENVQRYQNEVKALTK